MSQPLDLENLHEMTGNDAALEKELFGVFLTSAEECMAALRASTGADAQETWRTQAHALKGMSLNLGAAELGALCANAQMNHTADSTQKAAMLHAIEDSYAAVKAFLQPLV